MIKNKKKYGFWSRVWYHIGFHENDSYSTKITKEDRLPILVVLLATILVIVLIVYFS